MPQAELSANTVEVLKALPEKWRQINAEIDKRIVGQDALINELLVAIACRGHCLLVGVPGLAKTRLINTIGEISSLKFSRIQFTPDMMPSDITGSEIFDQDPASGKRQFLFVKGPVFGQLVLADEINRTPPKTQAALLEAMQERRVTVAGHKYALPDPFFVLATQNPIEQEGTYPLPEAQLDRFMFCLNANYPNFEEEVEILLTTTVDEEAPLATVINANEFVLLQLALRQVPVPRSVAEYAVKLVRATRPGASGSLPMIDKYLRWGAGPRACQYLALAAKVYAVLDGRLNASAADVKKAAHSVLRHRLILNYKAEAEQLTQDSIIDELLKTVK